MNNSFNGVRLHTCGFGPSILEYIV